MSNFGSRDFDLEIARGNIDGHSLEIIQGHNLAVGTSRETIWSPGGAYSYLSVATVLKISSDNANDTSAGTGARTVKIWGLDTSYAEITETVTLSGTTSVNTVNSYLRIYRMKVITAGTTGENQGTIYAGTGIVTAGVPANIYAVIDPSYNHSMMALWTVPAGKTGFIRNPLLGMGSGKSVDGELAVREFGEVFATLWEQHTHEDPFNSFNRYWKVLEKGDIEMRGEVSAGTIELNGGFEIILIDN